MAVYKKVPGTDRQTDDSTEAAACSFLSFCSHTALLLMLFSLGIRGGNRGCELWAILSSSSLGQFKK